MKKHFKLTLLVVLVIIAFAVSILAAIRPTEPDFFELGQITSDYVLLLKDNSLSEKELEYSPDVNMVVTINNKTELREYIDEYSESMKIVFMTPKNSKLGGYVKSIS